MFDRSKPQSPSAPEHKFKRVEGRVPDRESCYGQAWQCSLKEMAKTGPLGTTICGWVVEAPWAHPFWGNYFIAAVHLRDTSGFKPAKIMLEGATHEVIVVALSPNVSPALDNPMASHLTPFNFMGQWIAANDIDAEQKIEATVAEILAGTLSPDTDFRKAWVERFSDSNVLP